MSLAQWAQVSPERAAVIFGKDDTRLSYHELDEASSALAHWFQQHGLLAGDHVAIMMDNSPVYFVVVWAARRAGLVYTPVNWHLTEGEAAYIVDDCMAKCLVISGHLYSDSLMSALPGVEHFVTHGPVANNGGGQSLDSILVECRGQAAQETVDGTPMLYSSGTTGKPKGILPTLSEQPFGATGPLENLLGHLFGVSENSIYLCPAPLYHAAPLGWTLAVTQLGGTIVLMDRFDAEDSLALIEKYGVSHGQFVPTMFIRMLQLDVSMRTRFDLTSLKCVIHAAAPCPIEVKERMMDWLGPVVYEYYAGSENAGFAFIGPEEWLLHKGSVGRSMTGAVHILDESGQELPFGESGQIFFESENPFTYHNDESKTAEARSNEGWVTYGDIGYVDEDGFIYLVDRVSNMIISGGVNIYPQEIENLLALHPMVDDVAVFGVPNPDLCEEVKAVIVPRDDTVEPQAFANQIIEYCRENIAHYKCPRTVDLAESLPRQPNGKLLKRKLKDQYSLMAN